MTAPLTRPDLSNRALRSGLIGLALILGGFIILQPSLGPAWQKPGSPILQSMAIIGSVLLLVPFIFSIGKRAGYTQIPNRLFILHVRASLIGIGFIALHALAHFNGPPLMMLGGLLLLVITGAIGRTYAASIFATSFGTKPKPFRPHDAALKSTLGQIIKDKKLLLEHLDPDASEALFSVTLWHLLRRPRNSISYIWLAHREATLIGNRQSLPWISTIWRPLHILLAWLFLAGMITHIIVVTFFAGYAADYGPVHWWHITAW